MTLFGGDRYTVDCPAGSDRAVIHGVLRLASPAAYDTVFAPVRNRLELAQPATVDVCGVILMNSSGIRALASMVLLAKERNATLTVVANEGVPWQKKTVSSLRALSPALEVELR